jgi:hypothetical protein
MEREGYARSAGRGVQDVEAPSAMGGRRAGAPPTLAFDESHRPNPQETDP